MDNHDQPQRNPSLRNYRVSKLIKATTAQSETNNNALPLIKIKNRPDNIVIPSVQRSEDFSPRSLDSRSLDNGSIMSSLSQRLSPSRASRGENRGNLNSRSNSRGNTFKHPVQVANQGGVIDVTIDNSKYTNDMPTTKLDILETFLPKDLRNPQKFKNKMHEKIRASQMNELNGTVNRVSKIFHDERILSDDYLPVHHSSGALSVTKDTIGLPLPAEPSGVVPDVIPPLNLRTPMSLHSPMMSLHTISGLEQLTRNPSILGPVIQPAASNKGVIMNRGNHHGRATLWSSDGLNDLIAAREERNNMRHFIADLNQSLKEHQEAEEAKQREEREIILKLKVVNTLFDQKVSLTDALIAAAKRASAAHTEQLKQKEEDDKRQVSEQEAIAEAIARSSQLEQRDSSVMKFKTADFDSDDDSRSQEGEDVYEDNEEEYDDEKYQAKLRRRALKKAMMVQAQDSTRSEEIMGMLADMSSRKMKEKLKNLAKFINSHTSRKVITGWNLIEGRFRSSVYSKTVMTLNSNGLTHPVKHPALFVSTFTSLLCSSKVKVGHQELTVILERLGFSASEILHARKVAALNLVLSYDSEGKNKQTMKFKLDLQVLMRTEERLVSIDELINIIFPSNPEEREAEFERIRANRQSEAQAMIEDKRKKEDAKEKTEIRRKKLISDFEKTLEQIQLYKGHFTKERFQEFVSLIKYCKRAIEQHYEDESAKISHEVMSFIGMDAFPQSIQDKVKNKKKVLVPAIAGGVNPFMKPKPIVTGAMSATSIDANDRTSKGAQKGTATAVSGTESPSGSQSGSRQVSAGKHTPHSSRHGKSSQQQNESPSSSRSSRQASAAKDKIIIPRSTIIANNNGLATSSVDESINSRDKPQSARSNSSGRPKHSANKAPEPEPEPAVETPVVEPRFALFGPPAVIAILRETVSFGRGLSGYPYRDVVATLQYIAATKLAAFFRGFMKRWRFFAARRKWMKVFRDIQQAHYSAWAVITRHNNETRQYCWRKLKAWNFYLRRAKFRRELFRMCFWPFYTWRKYSDRCATAKEKAHFLVHRVMPTVLTIRVFRAWKRYAVHEVKLNRAADVNYKRLLRKEYRDSFVFLRDWAKRRRHIRRAWYRRGLAMRKKNLFLIRISPFQLWLTYTKYRKLVRNKLKGQFYAFMALLKWRRAKHIRSLCNSDRRMLTSTKRKKSSSKSRRPSSSSKHSGSTSPSKKSGSAKLNRKSSSGKPGSSSGNRTSSRGGGSRGGRRSRSNSITSHDGDSMDDSVDTTAEEDTAQATGKFNWLANTTACFDLSSDGEDSDEIPPPLMEVYETSVTTAVPAPNSFEFIETAEQYIADKAAVFHAIYKQVDVWNTFEASCRFHRLASRVFNNLRHYARIKRHVRKFNKHRKLVVKKIFFNILKTNAKGAVRRHSNVSNQSVAEQLQNSVRLHNVGKLIRIRKATAEVNRVLGRDFGEDEEDEETIAANRMKNLNLISEDNDEEFLAAENARRKQKQAAIKIKAELIKNNANLPNLLEWDRSDRDTEEDLALQMLQFGKDTKKLATDRVAESDAASKELQEKEQRVLNLVQEVFALERGITDTAIANQDAYVSKFREHAADNLLTVLARIYVAVQVSMIKEESKLYFRALRIPMFLARSRSMYRRKKLMNWIRICKRLNSISRHADFYARKRSMWVIYNRWLKLVEIEKLNPTPGVVSTIRRKVQLHPDFNELLKRNGFQKVVYVNNSRLNQTASEFGALFSRWKSYTQDNILFRLMGNKAHDLFVLQLKQKCFYALKTGLRLPDLLVRISLDPPSFPITRIKADLWQISKKFLTLRKKGLASVIAKYNKKFVFNMKKEGKNALSFKKFMINFENQTSLRISTEQRILSESFEKRGTQDFFDVRCPNRGDPILPVIMSKMDGKAFSDPHTISSDGRDAIIPGGFKIFKIKFVHQAGVGIIGWQVVWTADGAREIESPQRGSWNVAAMSIQEFTIPKDDFLIGIEYMYDGATIVGVRLKMLFKGFTGWVGGKTSLSTLSCYLGAEIAPKLVFEADRDKYLDNDEKEDPAFPSNFIIGLTGVVGNNKSATCLGIVVRKIKKQNIFSYYYVQDVISRMQFARSEFGVANGSQTMTIDAKSVPSNVSYDGNGSALNGDSLTMDSEAFNHRLGDNSSQGSHHDTNSDAEDSLSADDDDDSATTHTHTTAEGEEENPAQKLLAHRQMKRRLGYLKQESEQEALTSSEEQFFDVLRMRTTELSAAVDRAVEFARRLWTDKEIRYDPRLSKLVSIRVVAGLSNWYFNTLSKRLIKVSATEKRGQVMLKTAKNYQYQAIKLIKRSQATARLGRIAERTKFSWTGKAMLAPAERLQKKEHLAKVQALKDAAAKLNAEAQELRAKVVEYEKNGYALLPRIALSSYVVSNYRIKIAAARHKESLLERMTLEEVKTGLFGTNQKENLLNRDQMAAIHQSLKNQTIVLKDTSSLDRLLEDVLNEEASIRDHEEREQKKLDTRYRSKATQNWNQNRATSISTASQSLSLGSGAPPLNTLQSQSQKMSKPLQTPAAQQQKATKTSGRSSSLALSEGFNSLALGSIDSDDLSADGQLLLTTPKSAKTAGNRTTSFGHSGAGKGNNKSVGKPMLSASMSQLPPRSAVKK